MSDTLKASSSPKAFGASRLTQAASARARWGMFDRKERWSLSWRGRLILAFVVVLISLLGFRSLYSFLAITPRANANILVVEGWLHEYGLREAVRDFRSSHYEHVFATGGRDVCCGGY